MPGSQVAGEAVLVAAGKRRNLGVFQILAPLLSPFEPSEPQFPQL